jgi:hypothetical protein
MKSLMETEQSTPKSRSHSLPRIWELILVAVPGIYYTTHWAMRAGKGVVWDQKNYHYYNVYAWLNGRMDLNVAPAGQHSWLNPILYVPSYWLLHHCAPILAGVTLAAWQGLNFVLIYALSRLVLQKCSRWLAVGIALTCAVVGFRDPLLVAQIGTTDSDYLVTLPVLAALCALCWAMGPGKSEKQRDAAYGLSGLLIGAAAGLKWTCFVYALGMTVAVVALWPMLRMSLRRFLLYSAGGILGFLPAGGVWSWILWTRYGNPILPYWNNLFRSPWMLARDYRDMRFPPNTLAAAISFPFQWFVGLHPTSEGDMRDARFAFLSVLIAIILAGLIGQGVARLLGRRREEREMETLAARDQLWLLLTFATVSYVIWVRLFSIQRYLSPLTLLSGLLLVLALDCLISNRTKKLAGFFLLAVFSFCWMKAETSDWRVPYGTDWFGIKLPAEADVPDTLFIMLGGGPMGYVVPSLPASSKTVRLIDSTIPENGTETQLVRRAREIIIQHAGPIRSLAMEPLAEADFNYLRRFGLTIDQAGCKQFRSDVDQFTTCPMAKQTDSAPPARTR